MRGPASFPPFPFLFEVPVSIWRNALGAFGGGQPLAQAPSLGVPSSGAVSRPGTGGGIDAGQLEPHSRARAMEAGVDFQFVPAYPPFVRIANNPNIVYFARMRTMVFGGNGVAAATTTQQYTFTYPTIVIARSGAAILADGATGLPVGRSSLDTFKVQMFRSGSMSDIFDAGAGNAGPQTLALGSAVLGTAAQPALIQGNGLFVDTGGFLNVICQTLYANLEVHHTIWCLEEYGPARG